MGNCIVTIGVVALLGMPVDNRLLAPAAVVTLGCCISTAGGINFSFLGFVLCMSANICSSLKVSLLQKILTGEMEEKFDPCALLFWASAPMIAVMLAWSLVTEGLEPYRAIGARSSSDVQGLFLAILVPCVNGSVLTVSQFFVTKDLGAVGMQVVGQAKMILTVLGGMVFFGEAFFQFEVIGVVLVLIGVCFFSRTDQAIKEEKAKSAERLNSKTCLEEKSEASADDDMSVSTSTKDTDEVSS